MHISQKWELVLDKDMRKNKYIEHFQPVPSAGNALKSVALDRTHGARSRFF